MALTGSTNEEKIWNFLKAKGLSDCGAAGLMGNLQAESGLEPTNLQNSFEKKLSVSDREYTIMVDNGTYRNFVKDGAGYGVAQWTYWSRKQNLLNYAVVKKRSIGDLEMQLEFLFKELEGGYAGVLAVLKTAKTIREASNMILMQFEKPRDQGPEVQEKRFNYSVAIYKRNSQKGQSTQPAQILKIDDGFLHVSVNGILVNSDLKCNADNYSKQSSRSPQFIVIHYTGNAKDTAKNNAKYFTSSGRKASAHFFVDDQEIYQSVAIKDVAWHCGARKYYNPFCRNDNSVGVEMCCTAGNYRVSAKTKDNALHLCALLCKDFGIKADNVDLHVLRHFDITHKQCPAQMVQNPLEWIEFKENLKELLK